MSIESAAIVRPAIEESWMKSVPNFAIKGGAVISHANRTDSVRKNAPSGKVGAAEKFKRLKCFGPRNVKQVRFINLS